MVPLVHIALPLEETPQIERYLKNRIWHWAETHATTGSPSEWFYCTPQEMANAIKHLLTNCLGKGVTEDGGYDFSEFAEFPSVDMLYDLAHTLGRDFDFYLTALNDVRVEFGLAPITQSAIFRDSYY